MAEAYAALMSLMHTSELILHPSQKWLRIHRKQIDVLLQKVRFLQEFLEDYSRRGHEKMAGLESQIANTACAAEDIMESHVSDQILARSTGSEAKSSTSFSEYIQKFIEEMEDLIETKVARIKETTGDLKEDKRFVELPHAVSSRLAPADQNMVGSDEKLNEIMDKLTGQQSNRQIIAIVGMAGIGKTTMARNVYDHPHVVHNFDIRAWVTISQNYSAQKIILALLVDIGQNKQESLSDDQLGENLYKSLSGMKYLIVMDDLWGIDAWDEIRAFFPDNWNGSRIMITTRLLNVGRQLSSFDPFEMKPLDSDQSWELLRNKVFGKEDCLSELEEIGKDIAIKCGGLPLAIVVIGGLLAKSNMTQEFWEHVSENLTSIIYSSDDENWLNILYLSYNNLSIHLKPCFLYMAVVPQGWDFFVRNLIRLWIAEGFLKPIKAKSLEESAYDYLTDLNDRHLIFVHEGSDFFRGLKICGMHDLLRDLCLREARKENFLFVIREHEPDIPPEIKFKRRLCFERTPTVFTRSDTQVLDLLRPASLTRSLTGDFGWTKSLASSIRLSRVLDVEAEEIPPNDREIMQLVNLRYMSIEGRWGSNAMSRFTSSISQFWSLQTLKYWEGSMKPIFLPSEIWDLAQLRHLCFDRIILPDPPCSDNEEHGSHILENLHTLYIVLNFKCTKEVVKRVPNLNKLEIIYEDLSPGVQWPYFCLNNLVYLRKLESLVFNALDLFSLKYVNFPLSLKELILSDCRLPWEDLTIVGSLPNLEELDLLDYACVGPIWCPIEGQFARLKHLLIDETDLLQWTADKTHFPMLEHLVLFSLDLKEIPREIGELPTLGKIQFFYCSDSTITSAEQIREEQENWGNEGLQVIVKGKMNDEKYDHLQKSRLLSRNVKRLLSYKVRENQFLKFDSDKKI